MRQTLISPTTRAPRIADRYPSFLGILAETSKTAAPADTGAGATNAPTVRGRTLPVRKPFGAFGRLSSHVGEGTLAVHGPERRDQVALERTGVLVRGGLPSDEKVLVVCELPDAAAAPVRGLFAGTEPAVLVEASIQPSPAAPTGVRLADVDDGGPGHPGFFQDGDREGWILAFQPAGLCLRNTGVAVDERITT